MIKNTEYLNVSNTEHYNEVFLTLADNGDWEYTRVGFGEDHNGLYIVDLDDSGELLREKLYVRPEFSVGDVLAEGVALNVFEKYEEGDTRGTYGVRVDNDEGDYWDELLARVLA